MKVAIRCLVLSFAICYLLSAAFNLKPAITCKNLFPFACCCTSRNSFCKDPYTHACKRGINVRAHVSSHARTFTHSRHMCSCVCMDLYKFFLVILYNLMSLRFIHKDQSFGCGYICKTELTFVYSFIFYVFCINSKFDFMQHSHKAY